MKSFFSAIFSIFFAFLLISCAEKPQDSYMNTAQPSGASGKAAPFVCMERLQGSDASSPTASAMSSAAQITNGGAVGATLVSSSASR